MRIPKSARQNEKCAMRNEKCKIPLTLFVGCGSVDKVLAKLSTCGYL